MRDDLPTGTVTFLFTDIEGSTELLHQLGAAEYSAALAEHRRQLRDAFARHSGVEVDTQGDAFFVAFADASAAVSAADDAQRSLAAGLIAVRMGLHTGAPHLTAEGYVGSDVHLGARIAAAGYGGQVLLSQATRDALIGQFNLVELGEHRVKGFTEPIAIFQAGAAGFPPLRTISNTNLPSPPSTFVGREREVNDISALLRNGVRMVTLTGPGGTGKTRLAIEAASMLVTDFKAGVFWVSLAALRDPAIVVQTIGQVVGAKGSLAEHIGTREMLLLLDNLEQVIEAAPELSAVLSACPRLRLLATSRELLRISGEHEYAVPPLNDAEAVELFLERAAVPASPAVAELCRRLDNLPLAIELAAARVRVLTPEQILQRLGQRLDLLKGGRDSEARQQTLRATIAWSYDLLDADEQLLLARLSVFRAGATVDSAEAVASADIDVLQSLVEKSLLRHTGDRFRMLETIREFASERLAETADAEAVRRRHAEFFLDLAERAEREINGPKQAVWWESLTSEEENLRAALGWSIDRVDAEIGLRLSALLWRYWWQRGYYREGRRWYEAALAQADQQPEFLRAQALSGLANMALGSGEIRPAIRIYEQSLAVFRRENATLETIATLTDLGIAHNNQGENERARSYFEESLALARVIGDARRAGVNLINLAEVAMQEGDLDRAAGLQEEALAAVVAAGDQQSAGNVLANNALVEFRRGNLREAAQKLSEAMRRSQLTDDRYTLAHSMVTAAAILTASSEAHTAALILGRAERMREEMELALGSSETKLRDEVTTDLRDRLGTELLDQALAAGGVTEHDQALATALAALARVVAADP